MNKFSVLISVYVKEEPEYFKLAVESVLNQSVKPSEIVIVKDGKITVELENVCDYFLEKYPTLFKFISLEQNMGLGKALQIGLEKCTYDLVARMDTDDIAHYERFEKQLECFIENKNLDIVGTFIEEFDEDITNILSIRKVPITCKEIYSQSRRRNPFNHMTVMFHKKSVLQVGNYTSLFIEDYYLWVRMIQSRMIMYNIPESLVYARTKKMFERRGGIKVFLHEVDLQKKFWQMGFINTYQMFSNLIIRFIVRVIPNKLRAYVYRKYLRSLENVNKHIVAPPNNR